MQNFLYMIFIYPVYMFVEAVFFIANNITDDYTGLSIIILSLVINIICLPMYNVAEKWQDKERNIQKKLKSKVKDIKAVFKGDECYMILSTYYRQNNYHPIYALRSMFALLIQIPFFIAAYNFLYDLSVLEASSFFILNNLGLPDGLVHIQGLTFNILPIIMTLINIAASAVYTKGLEIKDKIQLYAMSLIFLVLLYNAPSGLVLYWTVNNLFSLFKNLFYKIKLTGKVWYIITITLMLILTFIVIKNNSKLRPRVIITAFTAIIAFIPVVKFVVRKFMVETKNNIFDDDKKCFSLFLQTALAFFIFIGLVIPVSTIASSPLEFINIENIHNPFYILYYSGMQSVGCLFWLICLYKLFQKNTQKTFIYTAVILLCASLINAFIFKDSYGAINNFLMFEDVSKLRHPLRDIILNLVVLGVGSVFAVIILHFRKSAKYVLTALKIIIMSFAVIIVISSVSIFKEVSSMHEGRRNASNVADKAYRITKTGKNIFILMLDRSMNFFFDAIYENSELVKKEYTGFTVFRNAIAFGTSTNFSTPSLFGGYEYTPENINKRSDELLVDKHNEALSVLPKVFSENGWNVSFTDPSWLNYSWIPDLSVFNQYNMIAKNIDMSGQYKLKFLFENGIVQNSDGMKLGIRRNMLYFSFFRILPMEARRIFYANGRYAGISKVEYLPVAFTRAYSAIENIVEEVAFADDKNCLNIIVNNTTHEPSTSETVKMIGRDDLIPLAEKYCEDVHTAKHFYVNYLTHESCAKFFRFLKDNDCWDNSRIIIVGDHGGNSIRTKDMRFIEKFSGADFDLGWLIPLMMMKDFNDKGEVKNDFTFMTLADVPKLTTQDLPEAFRKNPFTGISFAESEKKDVVHVIYSGDWSAYHHLNLTKFKDTSWVFVKDNVYEPACWSKTGFSE